MSTTEVKILVQGVNFPYEFSSFGPHIMLHTVVILKNIAKMFDFLNPWKWSTIQDDWGNQELITKIL